ncbi:MAG: hypothetical protein K940chlam6_01500 [Chlamydiae bacterium]|nr:hypothetical protein [Chlamydiota bacterium]
MKTHLTQKKDWKYYVGLSFLSLSLILPLLGFLVPFLDLPIRVMTVLIGALSIGGPEIMIILAVIFLGKERILYFKNQVWKFFKKKKMPKPVSKSRYYFGLIVFFGSILPLYFNAYFPDILPKDEDMRFLVLISADLLFVLSFFILGANFWEKFKRLFIWDGPKKKSSSQ